MIRKQTVSDALHGSSRDFRMPRRRRQRECQKSNSLNKQNNNSAPASRFFVHFFAVTARLGREKGKCLISRCMDNVNKRPF